jgi:hypothetical protein
MNSRRAEGEVIRDSILHVAGNLDFSLGGPEIALNLADRSQRRSLYFRHAHERQVAFLEAFDGADALECYRRSVTVVPQQALALANSRLPYDQSDELSLKLSTEPEAASDAGFVRLAFLHLLSRSPTKAELQRCLDFLQPPPTGSDSTLRAKVIHALMNHNDFISIR